MLLSSLKEDTDKQEGGAPIYVGDATFFVRRIGTPSAKKTMKQIREKLFGPLHKWTEGDEDFLLAHWLVEHGVTNWEGVNSDDGELKYSKKAARLVFLDPEYYLSLNAILIRDANNFEHYLYDSVSDDIEELKKN
jgi:hypothetical protein